MLPATGAGAVPLLVRLRALRPSLSPAEDRVAEQVLADPRATAALTISELAVAAATSETTVMRFCKRLDLPGYPQLRLALAEESAQPRSLSAARTDISASDTVDDVIRKIAFADSSAVEETAQQLDRATLTETATLIGKAGRVDVYGSGASAVVGADLQMKLHRIGCLAFSWSDPHIALTSAALLGSKDVAIGISHSGTTRETIEAITTAKAHGEAGRPRPHHRRPRDRAALGGDRQPDRGADRGRLPVHRCGPAEPAQCAQGGQVHA